MSRGNRRGWRLVAGVLVVGLTLWSASLPPAVTAQPADCAAFDSQIWAQSVFARDPATYAALDPDGNSLACEHLTPGAAPALWTDQVPAGAVPTTLASVTDGDTIRVLLDGQNEPVRLILIDAPETRHPNEPVECYGQEATAYLAWLLSLGGDLYLEKDVSERDQYGRLLRYVWLDFGGGEVYLVNEAIVRAGFAAQSTFPPDVKYEELMREAARFARDHGYGLWSACQTDAAGDTNALVGAQPAAPPTERPEPEIIADPVEAFGCDPSYPDGCIPPPPPDLDCGDVPYGGFTVYPPDPHRFDGDSDGIGCE